MANILLSAVLQTDGRARLIAHCSLQTISHFVESSFEWSFELFEFLLDEIFATNLPADLQYYI